MSLRAGEDGYTLTEMLVVIALIGLLAAVLTPGLMGQLGRGRAKSAQIQVESVAAGVEMFRTDVGRYPTTSEGLNALLAQPVDGDGWTGPYLKNVKMLNDPWGHPLVYQQDATSLAFTVTSLGSDGVAGGAGLARDYVAPQ